MKETNGFNSGTVGDDDCASAQLMRALAVNNISIGG